MNKILPRLYLGDFTDAELVILQHIPSIITVCEQAPHVAEGICHIHAPIPDEVWLPPSTWSELVYALTCAVRDESAVLVHCRLGKSRSPSLICAYLATTGWTLETALEWVKEQRPMADPHKETWRGVVEWAREV